jgi:signal transduction histidine kinase
MCAIKVPPITCFPNQMNQVFMNLIVNAIHATPKEGTITITTRSIDEHYSVAIADTGIGIPVEQLPRIFDPGFTTKGVGIGTGLGLSIVYKIVQSHGGRVDVESEVGEGPLPVTRPVTLPHTLNRQLLDLRRDEPCNYQATDYTTG